MVTEPEFLARLALAALLGVVIGLEREWRSQFAGMRTHGLVACGAALFTLAGAQGFGDLPRGAATDPMRVAAQVVSGIGFLGAGAIIREGANVRGLTTAAALWVSAAVGVAAGAGLYTEAALSTGLVLGVLAGLRSLRAAITDRRATGDEPPIIDCEGDPESLGPVIEALDAPGQRIETLTFEDPHVRISVRAGEREAEGLLAAIARVPGIRRAEIRVPTRRRKGRQPPDGVPQRQR